LVRGKYHDRNLIEVGRDIGTRFALSEGHLRDVTFPWQGMVLVMIMTHDTSVIVGPRGEPLAALPTDREKGEG
jgi:hypothetical protein